MEITFQRNFWEKWHTNPAARARGMAWGLLGGLVGMLLVDLILMGALSIAGLSPLICFSTVGNTVGRFLSIMRMDVPGGVSMGIATHYIVGPALGGIFAAAAQVSARRVSTLKKCVLLGVIYAEIVSQPLFALMPLLLKMTASETLFWFVGSLVMHFIWGIVLGIFVSHGLRFSYAACHR